MSFPFEEERMEEGRIEGEKIEIEEKACVTHDAFHVEAFHTDVSFRCTLPNDRAKKVERDR